jgi:hypothetical protein
VPDDGVTEIHAALPASVTGNGVAGYATTTMDWQESAVPTAPENDNEFGVAMI